MNKDIQLDTKAESTWIDPAVKSKQQLIDWILTMLGAPLITIELEDDQLNVAIQNALEKYTKYAYFPEQYLTVNMKFYQPGKGIDLTEFNVAAVNDIAFGRDKLLGLTNSDIFFGPQAWFMGNGGYPFFGSRGNFTGSFTTYHNLHEFFDLTKRMTGSNPTWTYYKTTHMLRIMPEPKAAGTDRDQWVLLTCKVIPPVEELYAEEYVKRLALAQAKMILGTVRKKFQSVQLIGGGQLDQTIGDEGREEWNQLIEQLQKDESEGQYFCIS